MDATPLTGALELLRQAGVRVSDGNLDEMTLVLPDRAVRKVIFKAEQPPLADETTRQAGRIDNRYLIRIVESGGKRAVDAIARAQRENGDLIVLDPPTVVLDGEILLKALPSDEKSRRKSTGKPPWGRWAIMRVLVLASEPMDQPELARATKLTQQAVSQSLKNLQDHVKHTHDGYAVTDKTKLLELWLEEYPGPQGVSFYWYALDGPRDQAAKAERLAREMDAQPLISGDIAADDIAPWRLPSTASFYLRDSVDLFPAEFSPSDISEATLVTTIPADQTLWPVANWCTPNARLADPLIVLNDLINGVGPDAIDAANHLKEIVTGYRTFD